MDGITIVMAVYNAERFLDRSIGSVINQTYKEWSLLCVDDGSTDNSLFILEQFAAKDGRIRVFHKENGGPASARAVAYENLTTPYVISLDADDMFSNDLLENMWKIISSEKTNVDCVMPNLLIEQKDGRYMDWFQSYGWHSGDIVTGKWAFSNYFINNKVHGNCLWKSNLVKKYAVGEVANYNQLNADEYIQHLLFLNSKEVAIASGAYIYRYNEESITKKMSLKVLQYLDTCKKYILLGNEYDVDAQTLSLIKEYYIRNIIQLQIRVDKNVTLLRDERRIFIKEIHNAYNDAMQYKNDVKFADKKNRWLYRLAITSGYCVFRLTCRLFSYIKK